VLYLTTLNIRRGLYLSFLIDEDLKASLGPKTKMLVRKPKPSRRREQTKVQKARANRKRKTTTKELYRLTLLT
jgi:hypothetical protein